MAQALTEIYNSLNSAYNPQRDIYNSQLGQVDQQTQGAIAGLNNQKVEAFQGITDQANSRGMFYSGAPVQEQQRYVGSSYMPALANVQSQAQNQKYSLQGALAGIGVNQMNQANSILSSQQAQEQQERQYQQSLAQQREQFAQAQAAAAAQHKQSLAAAAASRAATSYTGTSGGGGGGGGFQIARDAVGGYAIKGANGKPATLAMYAAANGGGFQDVIRMLGQGSAGDKKLAQTLANTSMTPQQLQQKYPNIFGGI